MSALPEPSEQDPPSLFSKRRLRLIYLLVVAVAGVLLAYRLSEALNPLLLAAMFAYMLNPLVRILEYRAHLPRTAAIMLIYAVALLTISLGGAVSVRQSAVGFDKLLTKITGGWQIVPSAPARAPAAPAGTSATALIEVEATEPLAPTSFAQPLPATPGAAVAADHAADGRPVERQRRLVDVPVYGDGEIVRMQQSPLLGYLDVNQNGQIDPSDPEFSRESGRWRPTSRFAGIVRRVPGYLEDIKEQLEGRLPTSVERKELEKLADQVQSASASLASAGASIWQWVHESLFGGIARIVLYLVLVPVYTFFLLRGYDDIVRQVRGLLPGLHRDRIESIMGRIDRAVAAFFRGRLLVAILKGGITAIGLAIFGVDFALTIGLVAGILSLVPAVGPIVGMGLAVICGYGPDGEWGHRIVGSGVVFVVAEAVEAVLNPVLLGREVGLHPVTLLVSLFLFGDLFGLFGVLLAVPLAAIVKILGAEFILPELRLLAAEQPGTQVSGFFPVPRHLEGPRPSKASGAKSDDAISSS